MEMSLFLARVMGLYALVVGLSLMLNHNMYRKVVDDLFKNNATVLFGGLIALVLGILLILKHNIWEMSWVGLVTLFGWLAFFKGVFYLMFPNMLESVAKIWRKKHWLNAAGLIVFIIGLYLSYIGFIA